jgi:type I restriction enzyme R subunit
VVHSRQFSELLLSSIRKYQNRAIEAAQVIEELIAPYTVSRSADL